MITAVTGSSGHLGGNLVRALLASGRKVRALVREDSRAVDGLDLETVKADLLDPDSLVRAFDGAGIVYHLAARISIVGGEGGLVQAINVDGVRNVVDACLKCGVKRLVHTSSVHAFDLRSGRETTDEDSPLAGEKAYAYDRSKALGRLEVMKGVERGLDAVTVHPSGIIGPYDYKPSRMGQVLLDLYNGKLPSLISGGFDFVDVRDVALGMLAAEEKGRSGENYILSGYWVSIEELGRVFEEVANIKPPGFTCPMWLARIGAPFAHGYAKLMNKTPLFTRESLGALRTGTRFSHDKATAEFGYNPRPFKESIEDSIAWFMETGRV